MKISQPQPNYSKIQESKKNNTKPPILQEELRGNILVFKMIIIKTR